MAERKFGLDHIYGTQVVGGGPGFLALVGAADNRGQLTPKLLDEYGMAVSEGGPRLGSGQLGRNRINSNSAGPGFREGFRVDGAFKDVLAGDPGACLADPSLNTVSLETAGRFMDQLGQRATDLIEASRGSAVFTNTQIHRVRRSVAPNGEIIFTSRTLEGEDVARSRTIIFATGARENRYYPDVTDSLDWTKDISQKYIRSGEVLSHEALPQIKDILEKSTKPSIAVLGGSHSAFSAVSTLREHFPGAAIDVFLRSEPRLFFDSKLVAGESGYREGIDYTLDDICPATDRINRFGGLREDAAKEYQKAKEGDPEWPVQLLRVGKMSKLELDALLDGNYPVVVTGIGYGAMVVNVEDDTRGSGLWYGPKEENGPGGGNSTVIVDEAGRLSYDDEFRSLNLSIPRGIIPGAYGIGIGYAMNRHLLGEGEPSFDRPVISFNTMTTVVAPRILDELLSLPVQAQRRIEATV